VVFLLIPLSCIAHVGFGLFLGNHRQWPAAELFVMAASMIVLFRMLIAARPLRAWLLSLNIAGLLIVAGFVWWTQVYSSYPKMKTTLDAGDQIILIQALDQPTLLTNEKPRHQEAPPKVQLRAVEEEEIFLDASGQSFQLSRASPLAKEKEIAAKTPPVNKVDNENGIAFSNSSTATLLVFFRGWW